MSSENGTHRPLPKVGTLPAVRPPIPPAEQPESGAPIAPMPGHRVQRVHAGLMAMQEVEAEREEYLRLWDGAQRELRGVQAEYDALKIAYARQVQELDAYRRERDHAVARRAEVEAIFAAVLQVLQTHLGEISTVLHETAGD